MPSIIDSNNASYRIFNTAAQADAAAATLSAGDPDWDYRVIPDPLGSGRAIIKVYDEDGLFLGNA